jgi:hypothetical protein
MLMPMFGRQGRGSFNVWLRGIGRSDVFPKFLGGAMQMLGYYSPAYSVGNSYKLIGMTAKSDQAITGDLEFHEGANTAVPVYATTGKAKCTFTNHKYSEITPSSVILNNHARWQCFFRYTSGTWDNLEAMLILSLVAAGAS